MAEYQSEPPSRRKPDQDDFPDDASARAGEGRDPAEDARKLRSSGGDWSGSADPHSALSVRHPAGQGPQPDIIDPAFLDGLFLGFRFPASMESVVCRLAAEPWAAGKRNRAEELHDLIVQLSQPRFRDLDDLKQAVRDRFAWERTHPTREGG